MTSDRFEFVVKNYLSDSSIDLANMNGRVLAVWGMDDLNVDAKRNACRYESILTDNPLVNIIVFPNASHGLLSAPEFNYQLESDWPILRQWAFLWSGRTAYHPEALVLVSHWITHKSINLEPFNVRCSSSIGR